MSQPVPSPGFDTRKSTALMLGLGKPVQIAYAVPNAEAAAAAWAQRFGAGPFVIRHQQPLDVLYRGQPGTFDHTSAYGQWGDVMVELVQDMGAGANVITERFGPGESGLHHIAFIVDDLDVAVAHLAKLGFPVVLSARSTSTPFVFIDTLATLGHFIELYPRSPGIESFYATIKERAQPHAL